MNCGNKQFLAGTNTEHRSVSCRHCDTPSFCMALFPFTRFGHLAN